MLTSEEFFHGLQEENEIPTAENPTINGFARPFPGGSGRAWMKIGLYPFANDNGISALL